MLDDLRNIKSRGKKFKKPKLTTGIISVDNEGFQELKARVIKLKADQLDLLGDSGGRNINTGNPANIIPSFLKKPFTCEKCGKGFKSKRGLGQHSKAGTKCSEVSPGAKMVSVNPLHENYSVENLQERFNLENVNSELSSEKITELSFNPFLETESSIEPNSKCKKHICEDCGKKFDTAKNLKSHRRRSKTCIAIREYKSATGGLPVGQISADKISRENYILKNSELSSNEKINELSLNPFLKNESSTEPSSKAKDYICKDCGKKFETQSYLKTHRRRSKTCNKLRESKSGDGQVSLENDILKNSSPLIGQISTDVASIDNGVLETPSPDFLGKIYADEISIEKDVPKQSSPKPIKLHKCEFCHKEFKRSASLGAHKSKNKKCLAIQNGQELPGEKEENLAYKIPEEEEESGLDIKQLQQTTREVDIKEKQEILVAYFDTLVNTDRTKAAFEDLKILKSSYDGKDYVKNTLIYDKVMRGFARKNDFGKIQELWRDILASGLQPSMESYISAMMTFSISDPSKNVFKTIFKQVYDDFTSAGFTLEQALNQGNFLLDDKKKFMKAVSKFINQDNLEKNTQEVTLPVPLVADVEAAGSASLKSHLDTVLNRQDLDPLLKRQLEMETTPMVKIASISNKSTPTTQKFRQFTDSVEDDWRVTVSQALSSKISSRKKLPIYLRGSTINMHQFLTCVDIEKLTDILLARATDIINSENFSRPVTQIISGLGNDVMTAYHLSVKTNDSTNSWSDYLSSLNRYYDWYCDPQFGSPNHRTAIHSVTEDLTLDKKLTAWPRSVRIAVGSELFNVLHKEILIDRDRENNVVTGNKVIDSDGRLSDPALPVTSFPAFFKIFRKRKGNLDIEELKPHPSLSQVYDTNAMVDLEFPATDMPMLVPPLPWVSAHTGGYLVQDSKLIRNPEFSAADCEQESLISSLPSEVLSPIADSINQLGSVPWIVNKSVLELACTLFTDQTDKLLLGKTDLPQHPDSIDIEAPTLSPGLQDVLADKARLTQEQVEEYRTYHQDRSRHTQFKTEQYSLWCTSLYRLSLAKHFQDDVLWFPHNVDFRGRCYPIPSQLNHMGSDLPRALLVFAKGKKLGNGGLNWLKLHCINLTGSMKRESVAKRMEYAETILPKIIDSATNPLTGERWWLESDDPWQTFSTCVEIKRALEHPAGPEEYTSHLPIHQDGSCNGLQHYAALGRDLLGARAVNLVPADKPQDVYSEIAAIVDRKRQEDSRDGLEIATVLDGFVKRKVVKQTVMTTVYGVTNYGATQQIAKQLKYTDDFPVELVDQASKYLSAKTFESLNEMFTASQEIQDWLTECAMVISRDCKSNVSWVTPLGFPVIQPYSRVVSKLDKNISMDMNNMFKLSHRTVKKEAEVKINTMKNKNGFAPNFIHSLDSSHMMLTSLHLWSQGVTFASVHDCFWTHAEDVETMNKACREQFISLHSSPILEQLSDHFMEKYLEVAEVPMTVGKRIKQETLEKKMERREEARMTERTKREMLYTSLPKKGELDLGVIHDSTYFFC